jgi:hypothetical protein
MERIKSKNFVLDVNAKVIRNPAMESRGLSPSNQGKRRLSR